MATRRRSTMQTRARKSSTFRASANRIRAAAKELDAVMPSGIRAIAEEIMTDIKLSRPGKGVPKRDGHLQNSGRVIGGGKIGDSTTRISLVFGGPSAPYALIQHERMDYHHKLGEPRYMVRGIQRYRPGRSVAMEEMKRNAEAALARVAAGP